MGREYRGNLTITKQNKVPQDFAGVQS